MIQPSYEQMPQGIHPQAGGANAVSINIYNPQAYGSAQNPVQQPPYGYTNSIYQMPQAQVYGNNNQAQLPPQQYFVQNTQQIPAISQIPGVINSAAQPIVAPVPQLMPDSIISNQQTNLPTEVQQQIPQESNQQDNTQGVQQTAPQEENSSVSKNDNVAQNVQTEIPSVDTETLINNLNSQDVDVKAEAINKIAEYAQAEPAVALQVVSEPVMQALVSVINEDTTGLEGPTDKQIAVAEKISKGEKLTPEEEAISDQLSPRDKANKNRIFALYTLAMIQKLQRDELNQYIATQKANGEQPIEPLQLENLVGYNDMVNVIKNDQRPEVKVAGIQALEHVVEPSEKAKVEAILADSVNSTDEHVKAAAQEVLNKFESQQ